MTKEFAPDITQQSTSQVGMDFAKWEDELGPNPEQLKTDFDEWENELKKTPEQAEKDKAYLEEREDEFDAPNEAELEFQVLESPTEGQTAWAESNSDGTISEAAYLQRCLWRAGNVGHALDALSKNISSKEQAEEWLNYKKLVKAVKSIKDPYAITTTLVELETDVTEYAIRMNIDMDLYNSTANK